MTSPRTQSRSLPSSRNAKRKPGSPTRVRPARTVALAKAKDDLSRYLRLTAIEEIVITRHGRPAGIIIGFATDDDWFDYKWIGPDTGPPLKRESHAIYQCTGHDAGRRSGRHRCRCPGLRGRSRRAFVLAGSAPVPCQYAKLHPGVWGRRILAQRSPLYRRFRWCGALASSACAVRRRGDGRGPGAHGVGSDPRRSLRGLGRNGQVPSK